jgi:hypothetical protein
MVRTGPALEKIYANRVLECLETYLEKGEVPNDAGALVSEILEKWKSKTESAGSTPESKSEEVFWFALHLLQHLNDPDKLKFIDGSPAKDDPGFQKENAKSVKIAVECLRSSVSLPAHYGAKRPPPWNA